jgi:hypothetical protein
MAMSRRLARLAALTAAAVAVVHSGTPPTNFAALECAVNTFALTYASTKLPSGDTVGVQALRDALNVDLLCNTSSSPSPSPSPTHPSVLRGLERERERVEADRAAARAAALPAAPSSVFYVAATGGSDGNPGTSPSAPFATLQRAQAAARAVPSPRAPGSVAVYLRGGTYYVGAAPLVLTELDSNVTWATYPPDAAAGLPATLSGALAFTGLSWQPASSRPGLPASGVYVTTLPGGPIPDPRRAAWFASHPGWTGAAPPPLVASLFINGTRMVRARFPNANPEATGGKCYSATQRPGEGCTAYSACAQSATGTQPNPPGFRISGNNPPRGSSPTWGCPQCGGGGSFGYTIFPPPPDHPVFNVPLPGVGWDNTSHFSFWGSLLDRPSGAVLNAGPSCDGGHWANTSYANAADGVFHIFHSGLWGGHMYAINNITRGSTPPVAVEENLSDAARADAMDAGMRAVVEAARRSRSSAASASAAASGSPSAAATAVLAPSLPSGIALWLRADDLPASQDGQPLAAWPDASPNKADAAQSAPASRPQYLATGFNNGTLPCVRFDGTTFLFNPTAPNVPSTSSIFAVMQDRGTTSDYGSGVYFNRGSFNGVGTRSADSVAASDDDPAPVGTTISTLMLDWGGSPADPGHRNLRARPSVIAAVFEESATYGFVNGCLELTDGAQGQSGAGYDIGTRNDELQRFLVGDVAEVLVFDRALNSTERAAVTSYLRTKWNLSPPSGPAHCSAPTSNVMTVNFGYGGYQEARGSGINAGQHFYLENVLEELDVPGEWYYNSTTGELFVFPNTTAGVDPAAALAAATIAIPVADSIVAVNGSQSGPGAYATNISLVDLAFTQSRITFLEITEVPSGGDWSVHRGGALFVEDAEGLQVVGCVFNRTGGNAVIFSNHVQASSVTDTEMLFTGDSGVIFLGSTNGVDGSAPTYPNGNTLARLHIHEVGIYGKQTSCIGHQLSANTTIQDVLCYNGVSGCVCVCGCVLCVCLSPPISHAPSHPLPPHPPSHPPAAPRGLQLQRRLRRRHSRAGLRHLQHGPRDGGPRTEYVHTYAPFSRHPPPPPTH